MKCASLSESIPGHCTLNACTHSTSLVDEFCSEAVSTLPLMAVTNDWMTCMTRKASFSESEGTSLRCPRDKRHCRTVNASLNANGMQWMSFLPKSLWKNIHRSLFCFECSRHKIWLKTGFEPATSRLSLMALYRNSVCSNRVAGW